MTPQMLVRTIAGRLPPAPPGQSTFVQCFEPLFAELKECSFIIDNWQPDNLHPDHRELLDRYRIARVDVGRRAIDIYRGKRFLPTFGFAVPATFGRVFAFAAEPPAATLRSCTDGYEINPRQLAALARVTFSAFEGTWTLATPEPSLIDVLQAGLPAGAELAPTPRSLNFVQNPS